MPPTALQTIPITWPFVVWGLDMVGPLKGRTHKQKYLLVMVDKFTKWIEAKPVKTAESGLVIDFISGVVHVSASSATPSWFWSIDDKPS